LGRYDDNSGLELEDTTVQGRFRRRVRI